MGICRAFLSFSVFAAVAAAARAEPAWPLRTYLFAIESQPGQYVLVRPNGTERGWGGVDVFVGSLWTLRHAALRGVHMAQDGGTKTVGTARGTLHLPAAGTPSWNGRTIRLARAFFPLTLGLPGRCLGELCENAEVSNGTDR